MRQRIEVLLVKIFYVTIIVWAIPGIVVSISLLFMALFIIESTYAVHNKITGRHAWKSFLKD